MFTGLVGEVGSISSFVRSGQGANLNVHAPQTASLLNPGDSVAVSGVCLTAATAAGEHFAAEVSEQTLRSSNLMSSTERGRVNLELPLRPSDRLGGHIVQGHVDGTGVVTALIEECFSKLMKVAVADELLRYAAARGSLAVDGVSLTVAAIETDGFTVALIPQTLERTTLGQATPGTEVNLEFDILAKYIERLTQQSPCCEEDI